VGTPIDTYFTDPFGLVADGGRLIVTSASAGYATYEPPSDEAIEWLLDGELTSGPTVLDGEVWMSSAGDDTVYRSVPDRG